MDIRKFRHACLELTKDGQSLVIDPGNWSTDFEPNDKIVGVVITHEHADHFDITQLQKILEQNPNVCIFAHVDIFAQLDNFLGKKQVVSADEAVTIGPFTLRFTGGDHARMFPETPICANLGVIVNNGKLYYPGDSFVLPDCPIETLAVPASAPWMKISEAMDFIAAVKPKYCFPTHNALLAPEGQQLADTWLREASQLAKTIYKDL